MTDILGRLTTTLEGRYRIERELGQGGMATVYLAHDVRHDRKVALKVLRPELAAILGGERFLKEIRTTANLQHPHILALHDSGEAEGLVYYVMPYIEGESLRDRLHREKQLPVDEAVRIAREVAGALDYAHRHGVVHRDIKPENILLHEGQALVADFGIALAASRSDGGTRMTETGMSLGTPHYMAPEQAMGEKEITPKADIYALGCVLYEALSGEPPFTGPTAQAIIARVMTESPRSLTLQRHTIPLPLEAVVRRALEKLPADRFGSAAQFADALARPELMVAVGTASVSAAAPAAGDRRFLAARRILSLHLVPWLVAALALVVAAWALARPRASGNGVRFALALPASQALRTDHEGTSIALSPDGLQFAYVGRGAGGVTMLMLRALNQLEARPLPGTEGAESPFFSPDGRWLAFFAEGKLKKVAIAGGPPLAIADVSTERGGDWGPGDVIVFSSSSSGPVLRVSAAGGPVDTLTALRADSGEVSHRWPQFLPGGQAITFVVQGSAGFEIAALNLRDRKVVRLVENGSQSHLAPTGHLIYGTQEGVLVAVPFDRRRLRITGSPVSLLEGLLVKVDGSAEFSLSRSGALSYVGGRSAGRNLALVDREGRPSTVGPELLGLDNPRFSPDGRRIAFQAFDQRARSIRVLDLERGAVSRLTSVGQAQYPEWSPDGQRIAFGWSKQGTLSYDLYTVPADGSAEPDLLLRAELPQWEVSFDPRGHWVAYRESHPLTRRDLWVMPLDSPRTPRPYLRSSFEERAPAISPDGRWLAYVSDESGVDEIYVRAFPEPAGRWQISSGGGREPRWGRSGRTIYYRTSDSLIAVSVRAQPSFAVGERHTLFASIYAAQPQHANYDVSPDERRFVFVRFGPEALNLIVALNWLDELQRTRRGGGE